VASAATSPSSTKSRRTEPVPGGLSEAVGAPADADTADIADEAVVPDEAGIASTTRSSLPKKSN